MASTSTSGQEEQGLDPILRPPSTAERFDVYINHYGPDTRENLAKPLYDSLKQAGIRVYLDVPGLKLEDNFPFLLRDHFPSDIENVISSAKVHIAILSPRYAESAWCLAELALMIQTKARIIPLFYHVEPSDFLHIKGEVADAFSKHEKNVRCSDDAIQKWKECLQDVSGIKGFELNGQNENDMSTLKAISRLLLIRLPSFFNGRNDKSTLKAISKTIIKILKGGRHLSSAYIDILIEEEASRLGIGHSSSSDYIRGLTDLDSTFNWGIVVYILGSHGLILSNPVFWLCWSILVTEAVIFYSIRPYWDRVEIPLLLIEESKEAEKPYWPSERRIAGAVILKVGMSISLITLLLYRQDIAQRQIKILLFAALSIVLIEGLRPILMVREELRNLTRIHWGMHMIRHITQGHDWKAANFLTPSVLNAMIGVTGAIVLGGNLGSLMPETPFWIFISIFVVDVLAEVIHRFDCGKRSLRAVPEEELPKSHVAIILRLVVEVCLCYLMTREICQDSYFPSHMDANACNGQCQERSKQLLITMVVLGGFQAAGTVVTPLFSCVIGPHYGPSILFSAAVFIAYLLQFFTYKLFNGLKYVIKIIYTRNKSETRLPV